MWVLDNEQLCRWLVLTFIVQDGGDSAAAAYNWQNLNVHVVYHRACISSRYQQRPGVDTMQIRVKIVLVSVQQALHVWIVQGEQIIYVALGKQECLCHLQGDLMQW